MFEPVERLPWIPVSLSAMTSEAAIPSPEITTPPTLAPILGEQAVKNSINDIINSTSFIRNPFLIIIKGTSKV